MRISSLISMIITIPMCLFLGACSLLQTTVPVTKTTVIAPPAELVTPPLAFSPLVLNKDGSLDTQTALLVIVQNDINAAKNSAQLSALEQWLKTTEQNVSSSNKTSK